MTVVADAWRLPALLERPYSMPWDAKRSALPQQGADRLMQRTRHVSVEMLDSPTAGIAGTAAGASSASSTATGAVGVVIHSFAVLTPADRGRPGARGTSFGREPVH